MTTHETERLGSSRDEDWRSASLSRLTQHLERVEHVATHGALAQVRKLAPDGAQSMRDVLDRFAAAYVEHADTCAKVLFPRICAWERARCGAGPWPTPDKDALRERLVAAGARATGLRRALDEVRHTERGAGHGASSHALREALYGLDAQLARQLDLEALLFARAATLEPEP